MVATVRPEEWDEMRIRASEEMSELDRSICGADTTKHIILPMNDVINLRRCAGLLHDLATNIDNLTRRQNYTARTIILEVRTEIDDVNRRIRETIGKGKRRRRYRDHDN
jgi:hypothetical protein